MDPAAAGPCEAGDQARARRLLLGLSSVREARVEVGVGGEKARGGLHLVRQVRLGFVSSLKILGQFLLPSLTAKIAIPDGYAHRNDL
ncbi:hypothetical protein EJB05_40623, partial [Eragrostis curvula]